jgi:hypothetical protein
VGHGSERVEPRRGLTAAHPRWWKLWRERKPAIAYALAVDIVAVALAAGATAAMPVHSDDLIRFGLLVAGALTHREAVHRTESLRERATGNGPLTRLHGVPSNRFWRELCP